ncbi:YdbL family protein [Marinobacterium aestuariivivens]|uniref:YdbL family protein n=1 Tax=Marinobacterium aestuariivivens TaxID=1698799 RepID=A0ABW1ZVV5_9GAMM
MKKTLKHLLAMMGLALSLLALPAWALSLDEAKDQGLVGEQVNGYLGIVVDSPDSALRSLVADINRQRKEAYQDSAKSAGVELRIIELRIGQRLQQKAAPGHYIQSQGGSWQRK